MKIQSASPKPECNCPLPYRAKRPEEHEESCPVVANPWWKETPLPSAPPETEE